MRSMALRKLAANLAIVLGISVGGVAGVQAQQTLVVPFAGSLTGPTAPYGLEPMHGAMIAAEEINKAGGIKAGPWKGYHIRIEPFDDRGDLQESANVAQKIVNMEDAVVVIGHVFSGSCLAALPIYEEAGVSMATPLCASPKLTESGYQTVMRVTQGSVADGRAHAEFAVNVFGGKKVGLLWANNDWGKSMFDESAKRLKELNIASVDEPYNEGETDFSAILSRLKKENVDVVMHVGFYTEAALQARQAKQLGLDVPFFSGPGAISAEFIKLGGKDVEGVFALDYMNEEALTRPKLKELAERTQEQFQEAFTIYHRNGYDIMNFIATGLEAAEERSRDAVRTALRGASINGLTYDIKLDEKGDLIIPLDRLGDYYALKIVKDGKFVDYRK